MCYDCMVTHTSGRTDLGGVHRFRPPSLNPCLTVYPISAKGPKYYVPVQENCQLRNHNIDTENYISWNLKGNPQPHASLHPHSRGPIFFVVMIVLNRAAYWGTVGLPVYTAREADVRWGMSSNSRQFPRTNEQTLLCCEWARPAGRRPAKIDQTPFELYFPATCVHWCDY